MLIKPLKTRIFKEGDNLISFITDHIKNIPERSVVVITSKIVALSEKRTAVIINEQTKEKLIKQESEFSMPTEYAWLTVKNGVVMASAGIDESNADGKLILLPKDAQKTASYIRGKLRKTYGIDDLGILITDSRTMPFRAGITGVSLGYAGFRGIRSYRGKPDIFGRKLKSSRTNIADSLAASAVLNMGEGNERQPLAIIQKAPIEFCTGTKKNELFIDVNDDIYLPLFMRLGKKTK